MKTINIAGVDIDIHDGPISVSLSGGADSSLLFYILMKHATGPINVFSCGNGKTSNHEPISALKIINKCITLTDRNDVFFHAHWVKEKNINTGINIEMLKKLNMPLLYTGLTRPPPEGAIVDFDDNGQCVGGIDIWPTLPTYWNGNDDEIFKQFFDLKIKFDNNLSMYTPFINSNKQKIAEIYKELNVEHLFQITRSCESLIYDAGHCGTCWWCKERIWGFGYLE